MTLVLPQILNITIHTHTWPLLARLGVMWRVLLGRPFRIVNAEVSEL